jgi:hypothetical protein
MARKPNLVKSQQITITLSPTHPVEKLIIKAWKDRDVVPVGNGDYAEGAELIRRLLLRGYSDLRKEHPDSLPEPPSMRKAPESTQPAHPIDPEKHKAGAETRSLKRALSPADEYGTGPIT